MLQELKQVISTFVGKYNLKDLTSSLKTQESKDALSKIQQKAGVDDHAIKTLAAELNSQILSNVGVGQSDINEFLRLRNKAGVKPSNIPSNSATWSKGRAKKSEEDDAVAAAQAESIKAEENLLKLDDAVYEGRVGVPEAELSEVLDKSAPVEDWIADFHKSEAPQFAGKSKEERTKMALGAYYAQQKESVDEGMGQLSDKATKAKTTQHTDLAAWKAHAEKAGHEVHSTAGHHVSFNKKNHIAGQFVTDKKSGYIDEGETVDEAVLFTPDQIEALKSRYNGMEKMDAARLPQLHALFDSVSPEALKQLADSQIKFISPLAANATKRTAKKVKESLDEMAYMPTHQAKKIIADHTHGLDVNDPEHRKTIASRIARKLGKSRVVIHGDDKLAHEGEVVEYDGIPLVIEKDHDFIQHELANKDVNVKRVQKHPTADHHQIVVDKEDISAASATVRRHGLTKDYSVIGEDTIVEGTSTDGDFSFETHPVGDRSMSNQPDLMHVTAHKGKLAKLNIPHPHTKDGEYGDMVRVVVTNTKTGDKTHHAVYQSGYSNSNNKPLMSVRSYGAPKGKSPEHAEALAAHIGKKYVPSWK